MCIKIHKNTSFWRKKGEIFLRRGLYSPQPRSLPFQGGEGDSPSPHPNPLGACSTSDFSAGTRPPAEKS